MNIKLRVFAGKRIPGVIAMIAIASSLLQPATFAQRTSDILLVSTPVGLARGQSLRFTLFQSDGEPVRAHVTLFNSTGAIVAESSEVTIQRGTFHSFDFKPEDIHQTGEADTGRRELRSSCFVRVTGPFTKFEGLAASLEIIEDGLSTTLLVGENRLGPADSGGNGSSDVDYFVSFIRGETLRINLLNPIGRNDSLDQRADFSITVFEADGSVRFVVDSIPIQAGEFRSLDFKPNDLPVTLDTITGRAQVRVRVRHRFFSVVDRTQLLTSSVEIVNREGRTTLYSPGFLGSVQVASGDVN